MQAIQRNEGFPVDRPVQSDVAETPYGWILHPVIDLFLVCGGLVWIILALKEVIAPHFNWQVTPYLLWLNLVGLIFLADAHIPATLQRVYFNPSISQQLARFSTTWAMFFAAMALVALNCPPFCLVLYKIWYFWLVQHYVGQTYGIALIYCIKRNYFLDKFEKAVLYWTFQTTLIYAILRMCTYKEYGTFQLSEWTVPFWGPLPEWIYLAWQHVLQLMIVALAVTVVRKYLVEKKLIPLPALLVTATGIGIYVSNYYYLQALYIFLPPFWHGSQYLAVTTSAFLKQQGLPQGISYKHIAGRLHTRAALNYYWPLVVVGYIVYPAMPWLLHVAFGCSYGLAVMAIMATYSIHHFILDAAIWKLRDPALRKLLVA